MTSHPKEYVNPNKPFRFFRTYKRERDPNLTYPDFISMPTEGLRDLAFALLEYPDTKLIFEKAGVHGDIGEDEEPVISDFVERYVATQGWEKPDPANLVIATVLARQLAEGSIAREDKKAQTEFIEDKRCDGLGTYERYSPRTPKPLKASEIIPIIRWIDRQNDVKALAAPLRKKKFRPGEYFFDDPKDWSDFSDTLSGFATQAAIHRYGLKNRNIKSLWYYVEGLNHMYANSEIDKYYGADALEYLKTFFPENRPSGRNTIINDIDASRLEV